MSNALPLISVCIANFNGETVLGECIDSVLAQKGNLPIEILVHDDASTDRSLVVLRERYPVDRYPQIKVILGKENVGFCVSNNRMAAVAQGDYLLLLNNDAVLAADAMLALIEAAWRQEPKGILTLPQLDWGSGVLVDRGCLLDMFYNPVPNLDAECTDVAMVIGACLWLPRNLWHDLGGFPVWFESIAEDMYLCCQARLAGYPVQVASGSYYRHHQGASFGGNRVTDNRLVTSYRRRRLSERNKTFVMVTCSPPVRLWLCLPLHLFLLAVEGGGLTLIKRDPKLWREVYAHVFVGLAEQFMTLRGERQKVQAARVASECSYGRVFRWVPRKLQLLVRHGLPSVS